MQINITARHLQLTKALAEYVRKKIERSERYFDHLVWGQVILSVEKFRQVAEIIIHANKITFRAKEESIDLYAAIDLAADKIDKQLKKHKEISKVHRKGKAAAAGKLARAKKTVIPDTVDTALHITEVKRFDVKPTSLPEAVSEMDLMGYDFYLFLNADTSHINVIYRRSNGTFGLLEPEM